MKERSKMKLAKKRFASLVLFVLAMLMFNISYAFDDEECLESCLYADIQDNYDCRDHSYGDHECYACDYNEEWPDCCSASGQQYERVPQCTYTYDCREGGGNN